MCMSVPGRVIEVSGRTPTERSALIDMGGTERRVSLAMLPDVRLGDFVIVHSGYAIRRLHHDEAREALATLAELAESGSPGREPQTS